MKEKLVNPAYVYAYLSGIERHARISVLSECLHTLPVSIVPGERELGNVCPRLLSVPPSTLYSVPMQLEPDRISLPLLVLEISSLVDGCG